MKPLTPKEIEALRRRWREILKRAQEKGESPSAADIEDAKASNDPIVAELVVETQKALEDRKRRLDRLKISPDGLVSTTGMRKLPTKSARFKKP